MHKRGSRSRGGQMQDAPNGRFPKTLAIAALACYISAKVAWGICGPDISQTSAEILVALADKGNLDESAARQLGGACRGVNGSALADRHADPVKQARRAGASIAQRRHVATVCEVRSGNAGGQHETARHWADLSSTI